MGWHNLSPVCCIAAFINNLVSAALRVNSHHGILRRVTTKRDSHHGKKSRANAICLCHTLSVFENAMERLPEVETAKALMNQAMTWSVMKWLREKKSVRKTADHANAALDRSSQAVRERWPEPIRLIYEALAAQTRGSHASRTPQPLAWD